MSEKDDECVLVIPTSVLRSIGLFQGFSPVAVQHLPTLFDPAHLAYLPRSQAENDPSFKQLIPYVVLRCGGQVFHYLRGASGTEARLRALRSLGIGGHICAEDAGTGDAYRRGMLREIEEEIHLGTAYSERAIGLINDDRTPVGQVHLGIVHLFDLDEPRVQPREDALAGGGFAPLAALRQARDEFETWSQFLLDGSWLEGT